MLYSIFRADRLDEGAKDRFREMFSYVNIDTKAFPGIPVIAPILADTNHKINLYIQLGVSYGRASTAWFLRWMRFISIDDLIERFRFIYKDATLRQSPQYSNATPEELKLFSELYNRLQELRKKYVMDLMKRTPGLSNDLDFLRRQAQDLFSYRYTIQHFYDMADFIPEVNRYSPEGKSPTTVIDDMLKTVESYKTEVEGTISAEDHASAVPIIKFPDGSAWFDLQKGGCSIEAKAMGHCGNGAGQSWQTILSYRVPVNRGKTTIWKPHLTFILDTRTKTLGEMKGRNNDKPVEKYHPQIIALLKSKYVNHIRGGGYLPENNFSLDDLTPEQKADIISTKPSMMPLSDLVQKYVSQGIDIPEDVRVEIRETLSDAGLSLSFNSAIPFWSEEDNMWVIYGDPNDKALLGELFKPSYRHARYPWIANVLDGSISDNWYDDHLNDDDVKDAWHRIPDELREKIKAFIAENYPAKFREYIEDHHGTTDEEDLAEHLRDSDTVVNFICSDDNQVRVIYYGLRNVASDAYRLGAEQEAFNEALQILNDASDVYTVKIRPWMSVKGQKNFAGVLVSSDSLPKLLHSEALGILENNGPREWLSIRDDMEEPDSGYTDVDWDRAMEDADDKFAEIGIK